MRRAQPRPKPGCVSAIYLAGYIDDEAPTIAERVFKHRQYLNLHIDGQAFPVVRSH